MCPSCRLVKYARVLPYHCQCGEVHWGDGSPPARPKRKPKPRTFGIVLREMIGCGCNLPYNKWDNHGLQWCKENTNTIIKHLIQKPKPGLERNKAIEMVQLAIKIVESK